MQHTVGASMSRSQRAVAFVAMIAAMLCLLSACVSVGTPSAGKPIAVRPGEALVFGRIRMFDANNEHLEYSPFSFDPWSLPFGHAPRMTLELRQLFPPGGIYKYKVHPAPAIEDNGAISWILPAGDYVLAGNPRLYGSERFDVKETGTLAHFSVPVSGGTIYLGTLTVSIAYEPTYVVPSSKTGEAEYAIRSCRVLDDREQELAQLRARFPAIPEPVVTGLMHAE